MLLLIWLKPGLARGELKFSGRGSSLHRVTKSVLGSTRLPGNWSWVDSCSCLPCTQGLYIGSRPHSSSAWVHTVQANPSTPGLAGHCVPFPGNGNWFGARGREVGFASDSSQPSKLEKVSALWTWGGEGVGLNYWGHTLSTACLGLCQQWGQIMMTGFAYLDPAMPAASYS